MKHPLTRTIYLYFFAIIGLVLLTIGSVRFVDMGLKTFIFKKADEEQRLWSKQPPYLPLEAAKVANIDEAGKLESKEGEIVLSKDEKSSVDRWIQDYNNWQERSVKIDPVSAQRQRDASMNLAMILVGLPFYLFHWRVIRRETKNQK